MNTTEEYLLDVMGMGEEKILMEESHIKESVYEHVYEQLKKLAQESQAHVEWEHEYTCDDFSLNVLKPGGKSRRGMFVVDSVS